MPATPQSQAVALANRVLAADLQIAALLETVNQLLVEWNDIGAATILNNLPTCAVNADGTLGAADGAPNTAHPINTAVVTGLTRAISAADLSALVAYPLTNFQAACNGSQIAAIGGMRAIINKAQGG